MTILEQVYASGGDVIIHTLEITCAAWAAPILLCEGFENQSVIDENGRALTFEAAAFQLAEPERSNRGSRVLSAERVPYDGRDVNRIKVVDQSGRVRVIMDDPDQKPSPSAPARDDDN